MVIAWFCKESCNPPQFLNVMVSAQSFDYFAQNYAILTSNWKIHYVLQLLATFDITLHLLCAFLGFIAQHYSN